MDSHDRPAHRLIRRWIVAVAACVPLLALMGSGEPPIASASPMPAPRVPGCFPPPSGDWVVSADCTLALSVGAPGSVIVSAGAALTLSANVVLGVDLAHHRVQVLPGGRIHIGPGGRIESLALRLMGLEVTQAVQDLEGTVPLVRDKAAVVRAYVASTVGVVGNVSLRLHGYRAGVELTESPLAMDFPSALTAAADPLSRRDALGDSANFRLPESWTHGSVELIVEGVGQAVGCQETAGADNDCAVTATFTRKRAPIVWVVPLNTGSAAAPNLPNTADITTQKDYMESVYPVPDIVFVDRPWADVGVTTQAGAIAALRAYYARQQWLWILEFIARGFRPPPWDLPDQIYGATAEGGGISDPVWFGGFGIVARGGIASVSRESTMAHEINHNLDRSSPGTWGRHVSSNVCNETQVAPPVGTPPPLSGSCVWVAHPNGVTDQHDTNWGCGATGPDPSYPGNANSNDAIGEFGLDLRRLWSPPLGTSAVVPVNFPDFMSYCQSQAESNGVAGQLPTQWTSPYHWRNEFATFATLPDVPDVQSASTTSVAAMAQQIEDVFYVTAVLKDDDSGTLEPAILQPGLPTAGLPPGDYGIELQDAAGAVLNRLSFSVRFVDPDGHPLKQVVVPLTIANRTGTARIVLKHGERELDARAASAHPPRVRVISPNGGEHWSGFGERSITWEASDPDGDALTALVLYSPDDGVSWTAAAHDVRGGRVTIDSANLPGGDAARVRVLVSDGFHNAQDDSDGTFVVDAKGPVPVILQPSNGATFTVGDPIQLRGEATDREDGPLGDAGLSWTYGPANAPLGPGSRLVVPAARLGIGDHVIRLTARDRGGLTGTATVQIKVRPSGPRLYVPFAVAAKAVPST